MLDRPQHALIEEFGVRGRIEVAIEIGRIVKNLDVAVRRCLPPDQGQQTAR